jgi:Uri superfamily endonuclease
MDWGTGTYALLLALDKEAAIAVGKLGTFSFPAGYYLYIGSARGGLSHRLRRHLQQEKKLRWHIDYLRQWADVIAVWYSLAEESLECSWAQAAAAMPQAQIPSPGFGSSDCRCRSHLIHYPSPPSFDFFGHKLGDDRLTEIRRSSAGYRAL